MCDQGEPAGPGSVGDGLSQPCGLDWVRPEDLGLAAEEMRGWVREHYPTAAERVGLHGQPCWAADEIGMGEECEGDDE